MRPLRTAILGLTTVALAATVVSAVPSFSRSPSETTQVGGAAERLGVRQAHIQAGAVPDHSTCEGMTGLENAACRVQANMEAHPNPGLAEALDRLQANLAAQGTARAEARGSVAAPEAPGIAMASEHAAPIASEHAAPVPGS